MRLESPSCPASEVSPDPACPSPYHPPSAVDFSEAAAEAAAAELEDEEQQVRRASHGRRVSFGPVEQRLIPPRGSPAPAAFLSPATSAGLRLNDEPPPPGATISQLHLHPLDPISDDEDDTGSSSGSSSGDESVDDLETLACVGLMCASSGALEDHVGEHLAALVRSKEGGVAEEENTNEDEGDNNKENTQPGSTTTLLGVGASAAGSLVEEEEEQGGEDVQEPARLCVIVPEVVQKGSAFDLPELSLEALEQLGAWEAEDNARDDVAEAKARADSKARAALPRTFDLLQGVFGASGPCGMPLGVVLDRFCSTAAARRAVVGRGEAEDMLRALADAAPGYLTLAAGTPSSFSTSLSSSSKAMTVRISRANATAELRQKLKAIADKEA